MTFEEWWMDSEYDPMLYGPLSDVWVAAQAAQREEDAAVARDFVQYISDWGKADECAAAIRNSGGAA